MVHDLVQGSFGEIRTYPSGAYRGVLLDPRLPPQTGERIRKLVDAHWPVEQGIAVMTSGTTALTADTLRCIVLSRAALESSAHAVNQHLGATAADRWLLCLPDFHVGGFGIHVRAALSGASIIRSCGNIGPWRCDEFLNLVHSAQPTLLSLVPTQLVDILRRGERAPPSLRAVVIGGGALGPDEYRRARMLHWPVLPSYGCTEASSQVATAPLSSLRDEATLPTLKVLSHMSVRSDDGLLRLRSPALLAGILTLTGDECTFHSPLEDGWLLTGDRGAVNGDTLVVSGRAGDFVKVGGEGVNLTELEILLRSLRGELCFDGDAVICAEPDDRLGHAIVLYATSTEIAGALQPRFDACVLPFARIREVRIVPAIERTALGKTKKIQISS